MFLDRIASDGVLIGRARVRGAAERIHARGQFERALAKADCNLPGLTAQAILLVQRMALQPGRESFGTRFRNELCRSAERARRPWMHDDSISAEAVLFLDEAELVACLIRDVTRGRIAKCWWWRNVLAGEDAGQWLRRRILGRGEILMPALSMLVPADTIAWIAGLPETDALVAASAIARAFALSLDSVFPELASAQQAPQTLGRDDEREVDGPGDDPRAEAASKALMRLESVVPELRSLRAGRHRRRMLMLVFAVAREPAWSRMPEGTLAMRTHWESRAMDVDRSHPAAYDLEDGRSLQETDGEFHRSIDPNRKTRADDGVASMSSGVVSASSGDGQDARTVTDVPAIEPGLPSDRAAAAATARDAPSSNPDILLKNPSPHVASPASAPDSMALASGRESSTQFGGIFYLLNAALAMGLYGDFTRPRANNLEISPWDWLALIGRAWFGEEFVADTVWSVLARLASREDNEEPGEAAAMSDGWLQNQVETLEVRLRLALGTESAVAMRDLVCRHQAKVEVTQTNVHVHLVLADLPIDLRIAGLDRDPGWIPAAGRDVRFHFD